MNYALIISMGLFVISCNAAESSMQQDESGLRSITLMGNKRTFTSHVHLLHMDPYRRSMVEQLKWNLPPVWALLHCKSSSASTGMRRKIRNATEIHNRVADYNEKHKKHPIVRDPHWYMIWQDAEGALKGMFLGREKDALSEKPGYRDLKCLLTEPKLPARALAAMRQYMEGNLYNEAVDWYRSVLKSSHNGDDLVATADPDMDWWLTLHDVAYTCLHHGEFAKAIEMAHQSLRFKHTDEENLETAGLLCRAHAGLKQWGEAIFLGNQLLISPTQNNAAVFKALAEAYEYTGSLQGAFASCARVIALEKVPQNHLECSVDRFDEEYVPTCIHLLYYYNKLVLQQYDPLQLPPEIKNRLVIAATIVNRIPEFISQQDVRENLQAYQARYPRRYEIALQEANPLLIELAQEAHVSETQDPREYAIAVPESTDLPVPSTSAE